MDIQMPEMNGPETAEAIRSHMDDDISKPLKSGELLENRDRVIKKTKSS